MLVPVNTRQGMNDENTAALLWRTDWSRHTGIVKYRLGSVVPRALYHLYHVIAIPSIIRYKYDILEVLLTLA